MKLSARSIVVALLVAVGLVAGTSIAEAKHFKLFHPDQPPLSDTGAVRAAKNQVDRLDRTKNPGKNFISQASRRNSQIVKQLNDRRSKRNKQRAAFLQDKLSAYSNELIDPINARYSKGVDSAKREYARDVDRINHGNDRGKKKRAALRRAREALTSRLNRLAAERTSNLNRANAVIASTRQANFDLYKRISDREKNDVKALKNRLRQALADLRKRS